MTRPRVLPMISLRSAPAWKSYAASAPVGRPTMIPAMKAVCGPMLSATSRGWRTDRDCLLRCAGRS